jgi:hypothetical protein
MAQCFSHRAIFIFRLIHAAALRSGVQPLLSCGGDLRRVFRRSHLASARFVVPKPFGVPHLVRSPFGQALGAASRYRLSRTFLMRLATRRRDRNRASFPPRLAHRTTRVHFCWRQFACRSARRVQDSDHPFRRGAAIAGHDVSSCVTPVRVRIYAHRRPAVFRAKLRRKKANAVNKLGLVYAIGLEHKAKHSRLLVVIENSERTFLAGLKRRVAERRRFNARRQVAADRTQCFKRFSECGRMSIRLGH